MTSKTHRDVLGLLSVLVLAALTACGGDEATLILPPGAGGTAGEPSGSAGSGGTDSSAAGSGGTGGAGGTDAACVEEPSTPEEFLVRCTDAACRPFDNAARLTRYRAGEPLPEVP